MSPAAPTPQVPAVPEDAIRAAAVEIIAWFGYVGPYETSWGQELAAIIRRHIFPATAPEPEGDAAHDKA
jgi:hypothetical protein